MSYCLDINKLKVRLQYILPKKALTRLIGLLADAKLGKATSWAIEQFARAYHINLDEMEGQIDDYKTFNSFFARPLKAGVRPIDATTNSIIFPADGRISQYGKLKENLQLQAKGHYFTTDTLLGSDNDAMLFKNGDFMTVYLSPSDYHRVHLPLSGKLKKMTYIAGELFSVNPLYTQHIPELFSRNERVVCLFETAAGPMAIVLVGAAIVRSIETKWAGVIAPQKSDFAVYDYENEDIRFNKGDEIGKFFMGSTVICLFAENAVKMTDIALETHINMGQKMAEIA